MNTNAMFKISYGLYVLTAREGEKDSGCIINTAIQQTAEPNRISITVNKQNYTQEMISRTGKFNISMLDTNADFSIFQRFGFQSGRTVNKFEGFDTVTRSENGVYYLTNASNSFISGNVVQTLDLGTHTLFLADVAAAEILSEAPSVTYTYYQSEIKPKPQKQASTGKVWVCKICGYIYDDAKEATPFEALPADWTCPLCKHGKADFELQK